MSTTRTSRRDSLRLAQLSDEELLVATRRGDMDAYAQLWVRHSAAAARAARAITGRSEPDDLVSEAYASVLSAIRSGGGPQDAFRPYLFATIRNRATSWARKPQEMAVEDLDYTMHPSVSDPGAVVAERAALATVFRTLPERSRTLLWYLEVEGMKPREVAPLMAMSPNAVSALAYRARENLRRAWLEANADDVTRPDECRWVCESLAASARSTRGDRARVTAHISDCTGCRIVAESADRVAGKLRAVLLPLVLGVGGAAAYSAGTPESAVAAMLAIRPDAATASAGSLSPGGLVAVAVGSVAAVGIAATVAVAVISSTPPAVVEPPAAAPHSAPYVAPTEPVQTVSPTPTLAPIPTPPAAIPVAGAAPAPRSEGNPSPTPSAIPSPYATPKPTSTPTPPVDPASKEPMLAVPSTMTMLVAEPVTGTGAPGAEIVLRDGADRVLGTATVDAGGEFAVALPPDLIAQGMVVTATQTVPGLEPSAPSEPIGPYDFLTADVSAPDGGVEAVLEDADGDGERDDLMLSLSGVPGATVAIAVDGVPTGKLHELGDEPLQRYAPDLATGEHTFTLQYVDPVTGASGLPCTSVIVALPPDPASS